jgi:hypothetical protein
MIAGTLDGRVRLQTERRRWQDQCQQAEKRYETVQRFFHPCAFDAATEAKDTRVTNFLLLRFYPEEEMDFRWRTEWQR